MKRSEEAAKRQEEEGVRAAAEAEQRWVVPTAAAAPVALRCVRDVDTTDPAAAVSSPSGLGGRRSFGGANAAVEAAAAAAKREAAEADDVSPAEMAAALLRSAVERPAAPEQAGASEARPRKKQRGLGRGRY